MTATHPWSCGLSPLNLLDRVVPLVSISGSADFGLNFFFYGEYDRFGLLPMYTAQLLIRVFLLFLYEQKRPYQMMW